MGDTDKKMNDEVSSEDNNKDELVNKEETIEIINNNESIEVKNLKEESLNESDHQNNEQSETKNNDSIKSETETDTDTESEDEEDEEEPKLKYISLTQGTFDTYLLKDGASAIAVGDKVLVIGTYNGKVMILDVNGNLLHEFMDHSAMVNQVDIDLSGQFLASVSDDGTLSIRGIYSKFHQVKDYKRPVKTVQLCPDFSTNTSQQVVSGGLSGQLTLNSKGWLGYSDLILQSGDGPILELKWYSNLIAWASDSGIKVYNTTTQQRIAFIPRNKNSPRPDLYPCRLNWADHGKLLLIGWADSLKVVKIKVPDISLHPHLQSNVPIVEVIHSFRTDFIVSGLSLLNPTQLVTLAYPELPQSDMLIEDQLIEKSPPEIRIIDLKDGSTNTDILPITIDPKLKAGDYRLAMKYKSDQLYMISAHELILIKPRDLDDHLDYLLQHQQYQQAITLLENESSLKYNIKSIGKVYLHHLLRHGDYIEAAKLCPTLLNKDRVLWHQWIYAFANINQLDSILPYIPTRDPILEKTVYDMVLGYLLVNKQNTFYETIRSWPGELYDINAIIEAVKDWLIDDEDNDIILKCLAELYQLSNQPHLAIPPLLRLSDPYVIDLIQTYQLYYQIQNLSIGLMMLDVASTGSLHQYQLNGCHINYQLKACTLLIRNTDKISINQIVKELMERKILLHSYLHGLSVLNINANKEIHDLQVELYAQYDPDLLLPYLKTNTLYSLNQAYKICKLKDLIEEQIYLLDRMGNKVKALHIIIQKLNDVEKAIDYAKNQDDEILWEELLQYSSDKPEFLKGLLESAGTHLPPAKVVRAIPKQLHIKGLKKSIIKILDDYNLQMSLRRGCEKVLIRDCLQLSQTVKQLTTKGIELDPIDDNPICQLCQMDLFQSQPNILFLCRHTYHLNCLLPNIQLSFKEEKTNLVNMLLDLKCLRCTDLNTNSKFNNHIGHIMQWRYSNDFNQTVDNNYDYDDDNNITDNVNDDSFHLPPMVQL